MFTNEYKSSINPLAPFDFFSCVKISVDNNAGTLPLNPVAD